MGEEVVQINLRLGRAELEALDRARPSTTPRTLWIRGAIRQRLGWPVATDGSLNPDDKPSKR